jgi:hypothetical protein
VNHEHAGSLASIDIVQELFTAENAENAENHLEFSALSASLGGKGSWTAATRRGQVYFARIVVSFLNAPGALLR